MATRAQKTRIPHVPVRTPMFDADGRLSRTWIIFFEKLWPQPASGDEPQAAAGGLVWRTLLLKDSTVGDDIADHVPVQATGRAVSLVGVLRVPITSTLTVRVNREGAAFCTLSIPSSTAVDTPVESTVFTPDESVTEGDVLSWDVTASDGQADAAGVASFTLYMQ